MAQREAKRVHPFRTSLTVYMAALFFSALIRIFSGSTVAYPFMVLAVAAWLMGSVLFYREWRAERSRRARRAEGDGTTARRAG